MGVGDLYRSMFPILRFSSLALAAVAFVSASTWAPKAQSLVRVVLELYIAAFLLVSSPVSPREPLRDFDRQAAFYAGVPILLAATLSWFLVLETASKTKYEYLGSGA